MSEFHCFQPKCEQKPAFTCNCALTPILICSEHAADHLQSPDEHKCKNICTIQGSIIRKTIIVMISDVTSEILKIQNKVIQESADLHWKINEFSDKAMNNLKAIENQCKTILDKLKSDNEIKSIEVYPYYKSRPLNTPKLIVDFLAIKNIFDLKNIDIPFPINSDYINTNFESSEMKYFMRPSKVLSAFDIKTERIVHHTLKIPQDFSHYGSKCALPDGSLFCYNNDSAFIIDPFYNIKLFPYKGYSCDSGSVYVDGYVYIFGGKSSCALKYDLKNNKWKTIAKLPLSRNHYCNCVQLKNNILIAGWSKELIYYDTTVNSYSKISGLNLTDYVSKACLTFGNDKVYLLEFSQYIYESSADTLMNWTNIGHCSLLHSQAPLTGLPLCDNEKIYFANYYGIYAFNLDTKIIKLIKESA